MRILPMLALVVFLAAVFIHKPTERPAGEDWTKKLTWAEAAVRRNEVYGALAIYDQVFREASIAEDWQSLFAVGCALAKLRRLRGTGLSAESVLLRALVVAAEKRNQKGRCCAEEALNNLRGARAAAASSTIANDQFAAQNPQGESPRGCYCSP
jgi:hypothetical protein